MNSTTTRAHRESFFSAPTAVVIMTLCCVTAAFARRQEFIAIPLGDSLSKMQSQVLIVSDARHPLPTRIQAILYTSLTSSNLQFPPWS